MSVHTWGENPIGIWQLEVHNAARYLGNFFSKILIKIIDLMINFKYNCKLIFIRDDKLKIHKTGIKMKNF